MNLTEAYAAVRYCPFCGKELVRHPHSGEKACYVHGDFKITGDKETSEIKFVPLKVKRQWR